MDDLTPDANAFDNWSLFLVPRAVTHWRTAAGKRIPVEQLGANHAYNIVLHLAKRNLLDSTFHAPIIAKAQSWRVFGPWAALTRWWYDRQMAKQLMNSEQLFNEFFEHYHTKPDSSE